MRHFLCQSSAPLTPTARACGMFEASATAALIAATGLHLQNLSGGG